MFRKKERHPYWTKVTLICFAIIILAVLILRVGYQFRPESMNATNNSPTINDDESFDALLNKILENASNNFLVATQTASPAALQSEEVNFLNDDGDVVHTFLSKPAGSGPFPAILLLHGNESSVRAAQRASTVLGERLATSLNAVVMSLDWRDVGFGSTGNDMSAAIAYLRETPEIQDQPIVLMGLDYGAYLAFAEFSTLNTEDVQNVQGLVLAYGFFNPVTHYQFLQEKDSSAAARFLAQTGCDIAVQPTQCLEDFSLLSSLITTAPMLILHNNADQLVSVAQSQTLVEAAAGANATRIKLEAFDDAAGGHDFLEETSSSLFIPGIAALKSWMVEIFGVQEKNTVPENQ